MDRKDSNEYLNFDYLGGRKVSTCSNPYSYIQEQEQSLRENNAPYNDTREANFYQKVLPGLNCFAVLGEDQNPENNEEIENELDQIDPGLFADHMSHDQSPQQFFNFIERESEFEQIKNKKIGSSHVSRQIA